MCALQQGEDSVLARTSIAISDRALLKQSVQHQLVFIGDCCRQSLCFFSCKLEIFKESHCVTFALSPNIDSRRSEVNTDGNDAFVWSAVGTLCQRIFAVLFGFARAL
jgi:hypothetical protein